MFHSKYQFRLFCLISSYNRGSNDGPIDCVNLSYIIDGFYIKIGQNK